ncbi:hypothetical protein ACFQRB_19175 [Halobaculum litoreum]|uniref:Uncharacterized protein n=1 Tax=Halobaculum litoreum TaxID=3031998 RepID=A0ABD5XXT5_9EURY
MVSERLWIDAGRGLVFLLLYGLIAEALTPRFHPYLRAAAALALALAAIGAVDVGPRLIRGDRPLLDTDSRLYSVRGLALLTLLILVTAITADGLRAATTLPETVVTLAGFAVGVLVVLGPIAGYYWRRSAASPS